MTTDQKHGARITFSDGRVEWRVGMPSAIAREVMADDPGAKVAPRMVADFPVEHGGKAGAEVAVDDRVVVRKYGVDKVGRVVRVGRTRVDVEIAVGSGTTFRRKVVTVAKTEIRRSTI